MLNLLFSLLVIFAFFLPTIVQTANSDIAVNEIAAYEKSGCEWIEVQNIGDAPISLEGWKFWENETNHGLKISSFSQGTDWTIAPGAYAIIAQNDTKLFSDECPTYSPVGVIFDSSWSTLNEKGESIGLKDADGVLTEEFVYIAAPDHSLERKDTKIQDYTAANWREHESQHSFGRQNDGSIIVVTKSGDQAEVLSGSSPPEEAIDAQTPPEVSQTPPEELAQAEQTASQPPPAPEGEQPPTITQSEPDTQKQEPQEMTVEHGNAIGESISMTTSTIAAAAVTFVSTPTSSITSVSSTEMVKTKKGGEMSIIRTGIVVVGPGVLGSQFFYLLEMGGMSGIQVYLHDKHFPDLAIGDVVTVEGAPTVAYGEDRIKLPDAGHIQILRHGSVPAPTSRLIDSLAKKHHGSFISVEGEITEIKSSSFVVDDNSGEILVTIKPGTDIEQNWQIGNRVMVSGVFVTKGSEPVLLPRMNGDIVAVRRVSGLADTQIAEFVSNSPSSTESLAEVESYLLVTAGGLSSILLGILARTRGAVLVGLIFKRKNTPTDGDGSGRSEIL